jgi:alpha-glucosidase
MRKSVLLSLVALILTTSLWAGPESFEVRSPDESIVIGIRLTDRIYYNISVDGDEVMWYSPLSMHTSKGVFGHHPKVREHNLKLVDDAIQPTWGNRRTVRDHYCELTLVFDGGYRVIFRAYNDGVAYRFRSDEPGPLIVHGEEVEYRFFEDKPMINHVVDSFTTSYEKFYSRQMISEVSPDNLISLPSVINAGKVHLSVLESDVFSYPGMYLTKKGTHNRHYLNGTFPKYPLKWEQGGWGSFGLIVTERADFIAQTEGNRDFPWRALLIARNVTQLVDSDLVYKLARPAMIPTDWIRPGLVSWEWWNAWNLEGVDFETGVNNRTYEYFIDFAARNGIPYVIMDEGWSDQFDVLLPTPHVDMEHLTQYARSRGVGLILWAVWHTIDRQYETAFARFEQWGIAGIKVDFIDRDDQLAIEFYERMVKAAAKHQLLVNFHGCSKPTGLHRTYPNLVNYEAVLGNEYNKFSSEGVPPGHNVDIAFTRMTAGPLDYTPGAMRNSTQGNWVTSNEMTMSQGTRCHQLAMFVVYYAPIQMLCDAPTAYERDPDILKFISTVPVTWDETVVLDGAIGEYVIVARKKGEDWYIGGLNNWDERSISIDLKRFAEGSFQASIYQDSVNANRLASDYTHRVTQVTSGDTIQLTMKKGGGFAIHLKAE